MKETIRLCVALGLTCLIAGTVLVLANEKTKDRIDEADLAQKQKALGRVLGDFVNQPLQDSVECGGITFYRARNQAGEVTAVAGEASPVNSKPFGGKMKVLVGLDPDGQIRYVVVPEHKETPGLGTKVAERNRSRSLWQALGLAKADPNAQAAGGSHLDGYTGRAAAKIGSGEEIVDSVSGATVSSRAVRDAVQQVCAAFSANAATLLDQKTEVAQ